MHDESPQRPWNLASQWRLAGLAVAQFTIYLLIGLLSESFAYDSPHAERPVLLVVGLFGLCFVLHLASLRDALRIERFRELAWTIGIASVVFRLALAFSHPIQEVDIYRYLWDGATVNQGISPYRYSPEQVLAILDADTSGREPVDANEELLRLVRLCRASPAIAEIVQRVHYPELTTVYPPVSQCVFAAAHAVTPETLSVAGRVTWLKSILLAFDLATIVVVWTLLRAAGRHPAWTIAYAWCPLVLKEFANSGHLDTIAVFFAAISAVIVARAAFGPIAARRGKWAAASGFLLAMSFGAKLFAIVLTPVFLFVLAKRRGWRVGATFAAIFVLTGALAVYPMLRPHGAQQGPLDNHRTADAHSGLATFLSRWEMNDFLFLIVFENLRPRAGDADGPTPAPTPWFAVVPEPWFAGTIDHVAGVLQVERRSAAFLLTRLSTTVAFVGLTGWFAWRAARVASTQALLESAFLTLAWFWLLSPTQNPWYWTWALPFLPFARGRAWLAVSGLVFAYYLRFWLLYHFADASVAGTPYGPAHFFDYVVTSLEFGPWLAFLAGNAFIRRANQ
jgi:hypothetical protein